MVLYDGGLVRGVVDTSIELPASLVINVLLIGYLCWYALSADYKKTSMNGHMETFRTFLKNMEDELREERKGLYYVGGT